jgi:hypothetical protein
MLLVPAGTCQPQMRSPSNRDSNQMQAARTLAHNATLVRGMDVAQCHPWRACCRAARCSRGWQFIGLCRHCPPGARSAHMQRLEKTSGEMTTHVLLPSLPLASAKLRALHVCCGPAGERACVQFRSPPVFMRLKSLIHLLYVSPLVSQPI